MGKFRVSETTFRDDVTFSRRKSSQRNLPKAQKLHIPESFSAQIEKSLVTKRYLCRTCGAVCLRLRVSIGKVFTDFPTRKRDGSVVVPIAKLGDAADYIMGKGPKISIRRDGGVEIQHRLLCTRCQCPVAYFPEKDGKAMRKRLFVLRDAIRPERPEISETQPEQSDKSDDIKDAKSQGEGSRTMGGSHSQPRQAPSRNAQKTTATKPTPLSKKPQSDGLTASSGHGGRDGERD